MTERSSQLAAKAEGQLSETVEFLAGLTDADLQKRCDDDDRAGSTIGSVAAHVAQGYGQAAVFLRLRSSMSAGIGAGHGGGGLGAMLGMGHGGPFGAHHHGHAFAHAHGMGHSGPVTVDDTIAKLKRDGQAAVEMLRGLTDEQLDSVPPAIGNIADGRKTLYQVAGEIVDHQAAHLGKMRQAMAEEPESAGDPS